MENNKFLHVDERETFNECLPIILEVTNELKSTVIANKVNIVIDIENTRDVILHCHVADCLLGYLDDLILSNKLDEMLLKYIRELTQ